MGNLDILQNKTNNKQIILEKGQEKEFSRLLKSGIYKELNRKGLLTDWELRRIMNQ